MPEVFTVVIFVTWLYEREIISGIDVSDVLFHFHHYLQAFIITQEIKALKILRCVFCGDVSFAAGNTLKKGCDQFTI